MRNKYYEYFIIFFAIFVIFQTITGTMMFFTKIGYKPSMWFEYYYGSEAMLKYFPEEKDHFKEALTFTGRLKVLYSHSLAYGILIFTLTHLIRSININPIVKNKIDFLIILFYIIALLEIVSDILLTLIKSNQLIFLYIRFIIFIVFIIFMLFHSFLLIFLTWKQIRLYNNEMQNM
ncbi:MAG: hypothetical protein KatS3mg129_2225 [Leptospiraceae bacterium]|nr:MAG: hypothetical protein KatS3mg129_2225 [Leptospiraceae bacterium]